MLLGMRSALLGFIATVTGKILLEDNTSFLLMEDNTSKILGEG